MKKSFADTYGKMIAAGLVSAMRTNIGIATVSHYLSNKPVQDVAGSRLAFIQSPTTAVITKVLAAGELVGDKMPSAPNRTIPGSVAARTAAGALTGAVVALATKQPGVKGAVVGGLAALAGTFAFFHLRVAISRHTLLKEPYCGAAEDAIAIAAAATLLKP